MVVEPGRMGYWRKFFRNSDIFEVIEKGILIAASDYPSEFHSRRGRIAEMLFSCRTTRCLGCSHVELHVPEEADVGGEFRRDGEGVGSDCGGGKESKVDSSSGDAVGNYSYDEAEALTEEIEEESQTIAEVFRIKGVLASRNNESDSMLYDSLRKLQLMRLSVETLQATEIGKTVNGLRKHNSKQIRHIVRTLIEEWKVLVDDWVAAAPVLEVEPTPESVNPSSFDDDMDGLPSPPLDEGAFIPTTSMEFSKFFDGMDDNGNPRLYEELNKKKESRRGPAQEKHDNLERIKPLYSSSFGEDELQGRTDEQKSPQEARDTQPALQVSAIKHGRPQESLQKKQPNLNNGASRPAGSVTRRNSNLSHCFDNVKSNHQRGPADVEKKSIALQDKLKNIDDNSVRAKLEMAKRKLQERYQEAENAKKQRTIQVMELHDLPKQGLGSKPFHPKQGNFGRNWQNGRHKL